MPNERKRRPLKKSRKKNYTGWIDASGRDLDYRNGIIRIRAKPRLGSYNLLVLTENGKYVPVLSSSNEYTSSAFYLRADKKIFKLLNDASTKTMARKTETGVKLLYRVVNVADVEITFDTFSSKEKGDVDMIKVTAEITNRGPKKAVFSLKTILDTVLGEATQYHFYTSEDFPVKSEVMYRTTQNEKWFVSQNNKAKLQVFLNGLDISKIDSVALANYTTLDIKNWEPDMLSYRAFDTVLSYNNSAIGIFWPEKKLAVDEKVSYVYYLGFAADANKLECEKYIFPYGVPDEENNSEVVLPVVEQPIVTEIIAPAESVETIKPVEAAPVQEAAVQNIEVSQPDVANTAEKAKDASPEVPRIVPNVKFDISKLTKEQLSPEYIQNLLDRIAALEENDSSINREELLQLNAELDAILEVLRQ